MKRFSQFIVLTIYLVSSLLFAEEFRGVYEYSPSDLMITGDEWSKFCQDEKTLLSKYQYKYLVFNPINNHKVQSASKKGDVFISVGGTRLPLPFGSPVIEILEKDGNYFHLILKNQENWIDIRRSNLEKIKNLWGGIQRFENVGAEATRLVYPHGVTDISLSADVYSYTPADLDCVSSSEIEDKRILYVLGIKSAGNDRTNLKHVNGYIESANMGLSTIVKIVFESNTAKYEVDYFSKGGSGDLLDQIISSVSFLNSTKEKGISQFGLE